MSMNFLTAFERLIGHEGGFQCIPLDRGNWTSGKRYVGELKGTKFGISAMTYPHLDIKNLTLDDAKLIYKQDFWGPSACDLVPEVLKFEVFDTAVNSGVSQAMKFLQLAVGTKPDGVLGPITMLALSNANPHQLFSRFNGHRLDFLNNNPAQWAEFGRGWAQRIAENLMAA